MSLPTTLALALFDELAEIFFSGVFEPGAPDGPDPLEPRPSAHGDVVCLVDGEISNRRDLARALGLSEDSPQELVVATAYLRYDESVLSRLTGRWAVVLWNARSGRGLLARDRGGARPLFISEQGRRLVFASELRDLLPLLTTRPAPDEIALAHLLSSNRHPTGRTLFAGVGPLGPGCFVALSAAGWKAQPYWAPRYTPPAKVGRAEAIAIVRSSLASAVADHLPEAGEAGIMLSGGIDSSALAGVMAKELAPKRRPHLYSAVFPEYEGVDESAWIAAVEAHLDAPVTRLSSHRQSMIEALLSYLAAWKLPPPSPNYSVWAPMLARAAADGTEVMLEGSGGDELFGHDPWLIADRLLRGNIPGAVRLARTMPGVYRDWRTTLRALRLFGLRGAAPPWYHAARAARRARSGPPGTRLLRPRLEALLAEGPGPWDWKNASGPRWWRHLAHLLFVNAHELGVLDYLRRRGSLAGVRSGQPFMSPELADMILRLPPDLAFDREHNRPLLRAAVGELIPPSVANRTDKARFNPVFNEVLERDFGEIRRLLEPRSARISQWVEPGAVDDLLRDRPAGGMQLNRWSRHVWRLLGAECWLRAEEDPEFLARYR